MDPTCTMVIEAPLNHTGKQVRFPLGSDWDYEVTFDLHFKAGILFGQSLPGYAPSSSRVWSTTFIRSYLLSIFPIQLLSQELFWFTIDRSDNHRIRHIYSRTSMAVRDLNENTVCISVFVPCRMMHFSDPQYAINPRTRHYYAYREWQRISGLKDADSIPLREGSSPATPSLEED